MFNHSKIRQIVARLKKQGKTVGLCHGVFDLFHYGHLMHLKISRSKCDYLFVSITTSQKVNKGPNRPIHNDYERISILNNMKFVDLAFVAKGNSAINSINLIKPDFYFKGNDYKDNSLDKTKKILDEIANVKKNKGKIFYTNEKEMSSSKIINQSGLSLNEVQTDFLNKVRKIGTLNSILKSFEDIKKNKILVVGDLIIDKYVFGNVLGKSGKEPHMVFNRMHEELYAGGSSVIANHLADFSRKVTLLSDFSNEEQIYRTLKEKLNKKINHIKIKPHKNYKTCIKTRFIDKVTKYKLFGSYRFPNLEIKKFYDMLNKNLNTLIKKNNIIIIADYSNNFFDLNSLNKIRKSKKFIGAMAQKNSNNSAFHSLAHLKNFDLLCINEGELRSEVRDKKNDIDIIAKKFLKKNKLKFIVVTKGIEGVTLFDDKLKKYFCPSFNLKPVDKIGAGDSMLAILSILLNNKVHPSISLLLASLVSAGVVNSIGNSYSAKKSELERNLEFLFK